MVKLLEILNTKVPVKWSHIGHEHVGTFTLDESDFKIHIDEYVVNDKTLVDFGFSTNGVIAATDSGKNSAKIIGAVLNGAAPKIKDINPDVVLIAVLKSSGLVQSRKNLYSTIVSWLMKRSDFIYRSDWIENKKQFFMLIAKEKLTQEELQLFISQVGSKE